MNRPTLPAPVNGDFDIEMPDGMEACELTGAAAEKVIEDANSDLMPMEPRRRVVTMEDQRRMALVKSNNEAWFRQGVDRDNARQINEVKTDNLGLWG